MTVTCLYLDGFRNYSRTQAEFSDGVNVILGQNAQGKTNLMEAVYYLASGKSFRSAGDKELISFTAQNARLNAKIKRDGGGETTLEAKLFRDKRRELYAGGVKLKKASELSGRLTAVLFTPNDLDLIKAGAQVRRKLLDSLISQLRPRYAAALSEFGRLYERKTRILRDYREKPSLLDLLDDFNLRLAEQSAILIYYRAAVARHIADRAAQIHSEFSKGAESLNIRYKTVTGTDILNNKMPRDILPAILKRQEELREAELSSGLCLAGAHKDDLEIDINGFSARKFASQGQARTASVSIKLAERGIHYDDRGEYPVLLLDDVLSELDDGRQSFILSKITNGQVFITCCNDEDKTVRATGGRVLRVESGAVST